MDIFTESHLRANSIAWLPVRQTDSVCYLGKDTDVIAEKLRLLTQNTDCIEHAKELFGQKTYDYLICMGADLESELAFFWKSACRRRQAGSWSGKCLWNEVSGRYKRDCFRRVF